MASTARVIRTSKSILSSSIVHEAGGKLRRRTAHRDVVISDDASGVLTPESQLRRHPTLATVTTYGCSPPAPPALDYAARRTGSRLGPERAFTSRRRNLALAQGERGVAVRNQDERIAHHAVVPTDHSLDEVEDAARVAPAEEDREPGDEHHDDHRQVEEEQRDVVRDGEQPLDEREPAVELALGVGIGDIEPHPLPLVCRGVAVVHQCEVGADTVAEAQQLDIPVVPPTRVFLPEDYHQQRRKEQQARAAD